LEWQFETGDELDASAMQAELIEHLRRDADPAGDLTAAELIVGELLSNVVRHARSPITVRLDWCGEFPTLSIAEAARYEHPAIALPSDPLAESGRGLFIIQALAKEFAVVDGLHVGTVAHATLPIRRRPFDAPTREPA
jgi:anti-sigma regulatory factor (Ser/Thr protein kinase)